MNDDLTRREEKPRYSCGSLPPKVYFRLSCLALCVPFVVTSISILLAILNPPHGVPHRTKTRTILVTLSNAIDGYYDDWRRYPPDGIVEPALQGRKGAAALIYYLALEHKGPRRDREKGEPSTFPLFLVTETYGPYMRVDSTWIHQKKSLWMTWEEHIRRHPEVQFVDPWGRPLVYRLKPGGEQRYILYSLGPDPEDPADDIGVSERDW